MARSPRGRTFSSGYDDDDYDDGGSISTEYSNMTGRTGVTTGPSGFVRLNRLVLFWTSAMTLTVLTILSYFTMAVISLAAAKDGDERRRLYLEDRSLAGDDAYAYGGDDAYAGDDAAAAGDDAYAGDDAAAGDDGAQNDDAYAKQNWGEDNYEMGDDDQAYGVVDDVIAADDDAIDAADGWSVGAFGGINGFVFALSPQEAIYLILVFVAVVGLDYYGLEAIKELGNKAARFRVGAFAAFVLFLGNSTAAAAFLLGISKVCCCTYCGCDRLHAECPTK